eukprot:11284693-Ditylum_brightwellii.AAC.1
MHHTHSMCTMGVSNSLSLWKEELVVLLCGSDGVSMEEKRQLSGGRDGYDGYDGYGGDGDSKLIKHLDTR